MNFYKLTCSVTLALFLSACASTDKPDSPEQKVQYSGFLSNYETLKDHEVKDDSIVKRDISPELKSGKYSKLLIEPVIFYPAPTPNENVSQEMFDSISSYATQVITASADKSGALTTTADGNTLRIKTAITELNVVDKKLRALQYIPIAFLVTAASGKLNDMTVKFTLEVEIEDAATGKSLGRIMKSGFGETLANKEAKVTLEEIKPLLDNWSKTMDKSLLNILK